MFIILNKAKRCIFQTQLDKRVLYIYVLEGLSMMNCSAPKAFFHDCLFKWKHRMAGLRVNAFMKINL